MDAIRTAVAGKADVAAPASPLSAVDCGGPQDDASVTPRDGATVTPGDGATVTPGDDHGPPRDGADVTPLIAATVPEMDPLADGATVVAE